MTELNDDFEEFYLVRVEGKLPTRYHNLRQGHGVFLTRARRLGSLQKAARFSDLSSAEAFLQDWPNRRGYATHIQLCTLESSTHASSASSLTRRLMAIPYPYRRTAYNWMRGVDVIALLQSDKPGVLERHQRTLLGVGIDITQPSPIRLLPRKKRRIQLPHISPADGPKAYFTPRSQRPGGKDS